MVELKMTDPLIALAGRYSDTKTQILEATGASEDLLHVHAGLLIFVLSALALWRRPMSPLPLALVVFFAVGNEVIDWLISVPQATLEPLFDFANTVFWPAIVYLLVRRWRRPRPEE